MYSLFNKTNNTLTKDIIEELKNIYEYNDNQNKNIPNIKYYYNQILLLNNNTPYQLIKDIKNKNLISLFNNNLLNL